MYTIRWQAEFPYLAQLIGEVSIIFGNLMALSHTAITGGFCVQPFDCICKQDYEGENCERERTTPSADLAIGHILGGVVGGLLITIFILLAIISLLLWKRSGKSVNAGE